jgi:hypothetical protein
MEKKLFDMLIEGNHRLTDGEHRQYATIMGIRKQIGIECDARRKRAAHAMRMHCNSNKFAKPLNIKQL